MKACADQILFAETFETRYVRTYNLLDSFRTFSFYKSIGGAARSYWAKRRWVELRGEGRLKYIAVRGNRIARFSFPYYAFTINLPDIAKRCIYAGWRALHFWISFTQQTHKKTVQKSRYGATAVSNLLNDIRKKLCCHETDQNEFGSTKGILLL